MNNTATSLSALGYNRLEASRNFLADLAYRLDREDFEGFLDACDAGLQYEVVAYSPDLGQQMRWLDHDLKSLKDMVGMIPRHVRMAGRLTRHLSLPHLSSDVADGVVADYALTLLHTSDTGETKVIACGRSRDRIVFDEAGSPKLAQRTVTFDTTSWSPGLHVPV